MNPILCIKKWNDTFENADSRKRERLKYFYVPSGCDSRGYLNLVSRFPQDKAMMAFGVFLALCQLSATLGRSHRGAFENNDSTPMDLQQISCLLRLEKCHVSAALEILCDERVKWCCWKENADNLPTACRSHPAFVQGQGQGQGQEREQSARALADPQPIPFPDNWDEELPTESARDFQAIQDRINALHPSWAKRPHFTRMEQEELMANSAIFFDLTDRDWRLLSVYLLAMIEPEWNLKKFQPDNRSMFLKAVTDVLAHADNWERECKRRKVDTGMND